jgi:hypothetical protein
LAVGGVDGVRAQDVPPIVIDRQGSYEVGGKVLGDPKTSSFSCDHGYLEYEIPHQPRAVSLLMWHSSSAHVWQNRWDGGEGYQSMFLRRHYPVYLWDGPRVGRANWSCAPSDQQPDIGMDQANFTAWRFGPKFGEWYRGVQFPTDDPKAWDQATRARYDEFDTQENVQLQSDAGAQAIDGMGPVVILTNSAGGMRALMSATKAQTDNVKGIVAYENPGYVFPEGSKPTFRHGSFDPIFVPLEQFKKLTKFPIQFVWGDHVDGYPVPSATIKVCEQFVAEVNKYGGHAEILHLPSVGLKGNTHIAFADMNNDKVAEQLDLFLARNGLDGWTDPKP